MQSNFGGSEKAFSVVINCSGAVLFLTCLLGIFWGCFMLTIWFFNPKYRIFIPNKTHNILILLTHSIGLENRSRGNSTEGSNPSLSANHSTKSITYKAFLILSCINPCIKIPFSRSIFLTTDAVFLPFCCAQGIHFYALEFTFLTTT